MLWSQFEANPQSCGCPYHIWWPLDPAELHHTIHGTGYKQIIARKSTAESYDAEFEITTTLLETRRYDSIAAPVMRVLSPISCKTTSRLEPSFQLQL